MLMMDEQDDYDELQDTKDFRQPRGARLCVFRGGLSALLLIRRLVCKGISEKQHAYIHKNVPDSCMSEVQRVRLSRSNCMMRVESL